MERAYQSLRSQVSPSAPDNLTIDSLRLQIAHSQMLPPDSVSMLRRALGRQTTALESWLRVAAFVAAVDGLGMRKEVTEMLVIRP